MTFCLFPWMTKSFQYGVYSCGSKLFSSRVDPIENAKKNETRTLQAVHNLPVIAPWSEKEIHAIAVNKTQMFGKN